MIAEIKMDELIEIRKKLYETFEHSTSSREVYQLQRSLALEILRAEIGIQTESDPDPYSVHRNAIYSIGDALAWNLLHPFTIRQLGKYDSNIVSLNSQEKNYQDLLDQYESQSESTYYLFSDLTKCLTIGDVIEVKGREDIVIHEVKSSAPENVSVMGLLSGRIGRQFSKNFWITEYLKRGIGKLFDYPRLFKTILISGSQNSHFDILPDLIDKCLNSPKGAASVQAEKGLFYLVQNLDYDFSPEVLEMPKPNTTIFFASTSRLVEDKNETVYHIPILCFPLSLKHRILLNEVDIVVYGFLREDYVDEVASQYGYHFKMVNDQPTLVKNGVPFSFHVRFLNNVLIGLEPVPEMIMQMINTIETLNSNMDAMEKEFDQYTSGLPSNKDEMVAFVRNRFSLDRRGKKITIKHNT